MPTKRATKRPNKFPAATNERNKDLAMIHMAATQLGMDAKDESESSDYRSMLWSVARVRSSAALDFAGRKNVLKHLEACGWKRTAKPQKRKLADDPQSTKIRALWLQLHAAGKVRNPSEDALAAFVKRQHGVDALQWLSGAKAQKLIEELKKWLAR
jgi:phage gp16-like protein